MPVQRKMFRIEEHARPRGFGAAPAADSSDTRPRLAADRNALELTRAQVAEAQAFKQELALIHAAVERSRDEMTTLAADAQRDDTARASRELAAIVGGTERATQAILRAAEEIDQAATALSPALKSTHDKGLAHDIAERVVQIFEACNFQDITGQRVDHVVATLKSVEQHVARLLGIWARVERFAAVAVDDRGQGDQRLLNGPKLSGDHGHASQADVDFFFRTA